MRAVAGQASSAVTQVEANGSFALVHTSLGTDDDSVSTALTLCQSVHEKVKPGVFVYGETHGGLPTLLAHTTDGSKPGQWADCVKGSLTVPGTVIG